MPANAMQFRALLPFDPVGTMAFLSTQVLLAASEITEREWQASKAKQNKATGPLNIPRGCIPATQAAMITTEVQADHGTVTFRKLVVGCQLCGRTGIDVRATSQPRLSDNSQTQHWVLCLPCEQGSKLPLERQLEGIREATLSSIKWECKSPVCDQCRFPFKRASAFADYTRQAPLWPPWMKMWCHGCRNSLKETGMVPRPSVLQGTHFTFADVNHPAYQ